jgi:hypothetical protein
VVRHGVSWLCCCHEYPGYRSRNGVGYGVQTLKTIVHSKRRKRCRMSCVGVGWRRGGREYICSYPPLNVKTISVLADVIQPRTQEPKSVHLNHLPSHGSAANSGQCLVSLNTSPRIGYPRLTPSPVLVSAKAHCISRGMAADFGRLRSAHS